MARPKLIETAEERRARLNANHRRWHANHAAEESARDAAKRKAKPELAVARTRRHRAKDPAATKERQRIQWLWWKYKITVEEYDALVKEQGDRCGICGVDTVGGAHNKYWVVDHCHRTGVVRGLLCDACNRGGGCFKDDPDLLSKAADWFNRR